MMELNATSNATLDGDEGRGMLRRTILTNVTVNTTLDSDDSWGMLRRTISNFTANATVENEDASTETPAVTFEEEEEV